MSLFGSSRPAGITEQELTFIRGELMSAPFGHSDQKLTSTQLEEIMEDLKLATDSHTALELKYGWKQVDAPQAATIEQNAANNHGLRYTPAQLAHIHQVFTKYLTINRTKSFI